MNKDFKITVNRNVPPGHRLTPYFSCIEQGVALARESLPRTTSSYMEYAGVEAWQSGQTGDHDHIRAEIKISGQYGVPGAVQLWKYATTFSISLVSLPSEREVTEEARKQTKEAVLDMLKRYGSDVQKAGSEMLKAAETPLLLM